MSDFLQGGIGWRVQFIIDAESGELRFASVADIEALRNSAARTSYLVLGAGDGHGKKGYQLLRSHFR